MSDSKRAVPVLYNFIEEPPLVSVSVFKLLLIYHVNPMMSIRMEKTGIATRKREDKEASFVQF